MKKGLISILLLSFSTFCFGQNSQDTVLTNDTCYIRIPNILNSSCPPAHENWVYYNCVPDSMEFKLFNRWGNLVFETDDIEANWNGESNLMENKQLPEGTYFYILTYVFPGKGEERTGYLLIMR